MVIIGGYYRRSGSDSRGVRNLTMNLGLIKRKGTI